MNEEFASFSNGQSMPIAYYVWRPENAPIKAVVQLAHGMAELAGRYRRFAEKLTQSGFLVTANDHRGHGHSAASLKALGQWGKNGFEGAVDDMLQLSQIVSESYPKLPLFLFGHSMGSFLAQRFIQKYPGVFSGLILSGSNGKQNSITLNMGLAIAKTQKTILGRKHPSKLLNALSFGSFNNGFQPSVTEFDWLSRDAQEVEKYVKNPYCGTVFPCGFYIDFFKGLKTIARKSCMTQMELHLPVLIISGASDPVGGAGVGVKRLSDAYEAIGMKNVKLILYENARHELLNELNREEVTDDIMQWLEQTMTLLSNASQAV